MGKKHIHSCGIIRMILTSHLRSPGRMGEWPPSPDVSQTQKTSTVRKANGVPSLSLLPVSLISPCGSSCWRLVNWMHILATYIVYGTWFVYNLYIIHYLWWIVMHDVWWFDLDCETAKPVMSALWISTIYIKFMIHFWHCKALYFISTPRYPTIENTIHSLPSPIRQKHRTL